MRSLTLFAILLITFGGLALAETSVNTNSIQTSNITSDNDQITIGAVTNFASNSLKAVNNLFFSSTAYIVQENDGSDIVFQLDSSSGTRTSFLTLDNSALSAVFGVAVDMGSNQINNLADPTEPQDAATKNYVDSSSGGSVYSRSITDGSYKLSYEVISR